MLTNLWIILVLSALAAQTQQVDARDDAGTYFALTSVLEKAPERLTDLRSALERGVKVSIRDGDLKSANWFATRLKSTGGGEALSLLGETREKVRSKVVVPGGMKALMFMARGREPGAPERFFAEYAHTILGQVRLIGPGRNEVVDRIQDHFKRVQALEALGQRTGLRVTFPLSARDEQSRQKAAHVLDLLGWRLEVRDKRIAVSAAEDSSHSGRQVTASALDVDELAMQSALQGGGTFTFTVADDEVPVLLTERAWLEQLGRSDYLGGFAEALARNLQFAKTYAALSELDEESVNALVSAVGLRDLLERYSERLYYFSSALAVEHGRVLLPGGEAAAAAWSNLTKASPLDPARFFGALLRADDGRLLAYFFTLSQLDWAHQQFFTRSQSRTAKFYDLFKDSVGVRKGINQGLRECPFADFLSDVPIDRNGHVVFPGGPELWLVAKGHGSVAQTSRMLSRVSEAVAPDVEDEVLIRLARTRYEANYTEYSELDNFVAVARVESHRSQPLDARSALLLAQQFNRYKAVWPYFSVFTGLGYEEYEQFFALGERLGGYSRLQANDCLGQLSSLVELLSMLYQSGRIDHVQLTELFKLLCTRFAAAAQPGEFCAASLDITRALLKAASRSAPIDDPDAVMLDLLTDSGPPVQLDWKGKSYKIDSTAVHRLKYLRVLQLQKVTPLGSLFGIYDSLHELALRRGPQEEQISRIESAVAQIPVVEIPRAAAFTREQEQNLESLQPRSLGKLVDRLRVAASHRGDLADITQEFMTALSPQVRLALSGIVYAYYLDPDDLLVSEDPLFVRKHEFIYLRPRTKSTSVFPEHKLAREEGTGSYLVGTFAGFGLMAGDVATVAVQQNTGGAQFFAAAQLGALRTTRWQDSTDAELHLIALKMRSAREWIVQSALDAEARSALSQATLGLLSLTRRSNLLRSLEARDWGAVWRSVTLSDLYHLGDEYLARYPSAPWPSPTLEALRIAAAQETRRPDWLAQEPQELMGCGHTHLLRLAPYERYERFLLPGRLAERASEFKFYAADFVERWHIPARALECLSEPLARVVFNNLELTDRRDWRAVLDSFSRLNESMMEQVISRPWPETAK